MSTKPFRLQAPQPSEQDLLGQIVDYLRCQQARGRVVWFARLNSGSAIAESGKTRRFVRFYWLYLRRKEPMGKGRADLEGQLANGRYFALEVKKPGEKPTAVQAAFLDAVRGGGGIAGVVHGYADVSGLLFGEI